MSATFAKLFSSVCPRASDFTGHFSASMLVKTTNTAQDELCSSTEGRRAMK